MGMSHMPLNLGRADDALIEFVRADYENFETMAAEWLQKGCRMFSIWGHELIFCRPASAWDEVKKAGHSEGTFSSPIKREEQIVGRIVLVGGAEIPSAQSFLDHQTSLVSSYLTMKIKFEQAAQELVAQAQLKTEIDMAAQIQQRLLLEKLPQVDGLDLYACSRAAQEVGGDFYDFFFVENRIVFVVGDISGKGLRAALFMVMARIVVRTAAHALAAVNPQDILACANTNLYDDFTDVGLLATAFVGCYDPRKRQLTYTNGAHSPIIYCPRSGRACFLEADSLPLGVFPTMTSMNHALTFEVGDLLIIGTDGLNECRSMKGDMFGNERLLKAVETLAHLSANQLGTELFETITVFAQGARQSDDQTLVVIKGVNGIK